MSVKKNEAGTWDYECEFVGQCGDLATGIPFRSTQWPKKAQAEARGQEHEEEHKTGEPMRPLHEFREEHGVVI